jgi:hypothetical protein
MALVSHEEVPHAEGTELSWWETPTTQVQVLFDSNLCAYFLLTVSASSS